MCIWVNDSMYYITLVSTQKMYIDWNETYSVYTSVVSSCIVQENEAYSNLDIFTTFLDIGGTDPCPHNGYAIGK